MVEEAAAADVAPSRATVAIGGRMGAEQYNGNIIKACICVIGIVPPNYKMCRLSFHATIPRAVCKENPAAIQFSFPTISHDVCCTRRKILLQIFALQQLEATAVASSSGGNDAHLRRVCVILITFLSSRVGAVNRD